MFYQQMTHLLCIKADANTFEASVIDMLPGDFLEYGPSPFIEEGFRYICPLSGPLTVDEMSALIDSGEGLVSDSRVIAVIDLDGNSEVQ